MADKSKETEKVEKKEKIDNTIPSGTMVMCDDGTERPVITRNEAIEDGVNRYFTGTMCQNGHMCERKVKGYVCTTCARIRAKARRKQRMAEDPEYKAKMAKKRADKHKERYANDPEYKAKVLDRAKARRQRKAAEKKESQAEKEILGSNSGPSDPNLKSDPEEA